MILNAMRGAATPEQGSRLDGRNKKKTYVIFLFHSWSHEPLLRTWQFADRHWFVVNSWNILCILLIKLDGQYIQWVFDVAHCVI